MNYLTLFNMHVDIVLIAFMFSGKILFLKVVLMLYYEYATSIYDGMYVRNVVNILN